jgi:hypothetical protein
MKVGEKLPFSLSPMRSWSKFLDLSEFGVPKPKVAIERMSENLDYWQSNYLLILFLFFVGPLCDSCRHLSFFLGGRLGS